VATCRADQTERAEVLPDEALELLYRQMHNLAGPRRDLDDLVQAAAERAVRAWPQFEGRSSLSTWTYRIAYRTFLDELRWFGRWRRRFTLWDDEPEPQRARAASGEAGAEAEAIRSQRVARLHAALDQLPPAKRAVVVLYELEELSAAEIASIIGTNERTVRSRLHDARNRLVKLLRTDAAFDPEEGT
jgi:RNA polymerase sigma-70 factor (ECF subfamily)